MKMIQTNSKPGIRSSQKGQTGDDFCTGWKGPDRLETPFNQFSEIFINDCGSYMINYTDILLEQ